MIGIPFEFKGFKQPSLIATSPRKAEDAVNSFLENLRNVAQGVKVAELFPRTSERGDSESV